MNPVIHVMEADLLDGTPVYDIKSYLPYADRHPDAVVGFASEAPDRSLQVDMGEELLARLPEGKAAVLKDVPAHDPRPPYQKDPERIYGMEFAGMEVKFSVKEKVLTVLDITRRKD